MKDDEPRSTGADLAKELRHAFNETADSQPESSAEFAVITLARAEERERAAGICARLAEAMENGAGELAPGNRLRQAERLIRAGESATPSASAGSCPSCRGAGHFDQMCTSCVGTGKRGE